MIVSGHRGAFGLAGVPENTLQAFAYAAEAGAAALEVDVRWTLDGRMVVLHDSTLDRTTRCTGPVEAITYAALRRCATAAEVPTFAATLQFARDHELLINPEVKPVDARPLTDDQAHAFVEQIHACAMAERSVVSSRSPEVLALIKEQPGATGLRFSAITGTRGALTPGAARAQGCVYMPDHTTLTAESVADFHAAGVEIWAWPARSPADYAAMVALGVDVVVADDPQEAVDYLTQQAGPDRSGPPS